MFWCVSRKLEWWSTQRIINWTMDRQGICCSLFWQTKKIKRAVHPCSKGAQSTSKFLLLIHFGESFRSPQQIHWYLWAFDMFKCEKMSAFDKTGEGQETSYRYCCINWKISSRRFQKKNQRCSGQKQLCLAKVEANGLCVLKILQTRQVLPDFVFEIDSINVFLRTDTLNWINFELHLVKITLM